MHNSNFYLSHETSPSPVADSDLVGAISRQYGVSSESVSRRILSGTEIKVGPGRIIAIVGPSGCGKSTAIREIARHACNLVVDVQSVSYPNGRAIVDHICGRRADVRTATAMLSSFGMSEAPLWIRQYDDLSDGEKFRCRLALAARIAGDKRIIICDEFASLLHRRIAKSIAFNIRKYVSRTNACLVLTTLNEDILGDLHPDQIVYLDHHGRSTVEDHEFSETRRMRPTIKIKIAKGSKPDYDELALMHYKHTDELCYVDQVFVMYDADEGDLLGIVVYCFARLELKLRNLALSGRHKRNPKRMNREMRVLRRVVMHPDVRGCGLGHKLVRETLPLIGTRFVECLAAMGEANPVFERAGMTLIGKCDPPKDAAACLVRLAKMGLDPYASGFDDAARRSKRVQSVVRETVARWSEWDARRVGRDERSLDSVLRTFRNIAESRPLYYIWSRNGDPFEKPK